jgi:hypothetical protein
MCLAQLLASGSDELAQMIEEEGARLAFERAMRSPDAAIAKDAEEAMRLLNARHAA